MKPEPLPTCCWNCTKSGDYFAEKTGWTCKEERPEQMQRGLHGCEGFNPYQEVSKCRR